MVFSPSWEWTEQRRKSHLWWSWILYWKKFWAKLCKLEKNLRIDGTTLPSFSLISCWSAIWNSVWRYFCNQYGLYQALSLCREETSYQRSSLWRFNTSSISMETISRNKILHHGTKSRVLLVVSHLTVGVNFAWSIPVFLSGFEKVHPDLSTSTERLFFRPIPYFDHLGR